MPGDAGNWKLQRCLSALSGGVVSFPAASPVSPASEVVMGSSGDRSAQEGGTHRIDGLLAKHTRPPHLLPCLLASQGAVASGWTETLLLVSRSEESVPLGGGQARSDPNASRSEPPIS